MLASTAAIGSRTENRVPSPTRLETSIRPPASSTMVLEIARPIPVPPSLLVVKNGSNTRSNMSSGMPLPLSDTSRRTDSFSGRSSIRMRFSSLGRSGIAWMAFTSRLVTT